MAGYAIVEVGSKQYWVEPDAVIEVEKFDIADGQKEVTLNNVLFLHDGTQVRVGTPCLEGAAVRCDFLGEFRGDKVISFKFRKRKGYHRKVGHRQNLFRLRVKEIKG